MDGIQTALMLAVGVALALFIWLAWILRKMEVELGQMQKHIRKIEAGAEELSKRFGLTAGGRGRG